MAEGTVSGILGGSGGFGGFGGMLEIALLVLTTIVILGLGSGVVWWMVKKRKKYNLSVEIKIARSDWKLLTAEWAKGAYDNNRGVVWIKRKGKKPVATKPFDVSKYLQGKDNILTVVQISPDHYIPILLESFLEMEDDESGEQAALAKVVADYSKSKAWKNSFEREAKQAYTVMNLLKDYAPVIGMGIILFFNFVGFAILYTRIT